LKTSPVKTSLLLIGSWPGQLRDLGAVLTGDLGEAHLALQDSSFDVVALSVTAILEKRFAEFYTKLKERNPSAQILLVVPQEYDPKALVHIYCKYNVHRVLNGFNDPNFNEFIFSALEKAQEEKQNQNLETLIQEQNNDLLRLQEELEQRIEKRARSLSESRHRLRITNSRTEALRLSMLAVYRATSITEMEKFLNEALVSVAQCSWIKIVMHPQDQSFQSEIKEMGTFSQLQIPLFKEQERIGSLFFMRPPAEHFTREETEFLNRVAEAVALAVVRIQKLSDSQTVKEQWETTFNSMSDAVAIISQDYDIVQTNSTFQSVTQNADAGKKCFQILFKRNAPCPGCKLGSRFAVESADKDKKTFEVHSQSIRMEGDRRNLFFNAYHNITEKLLMEKQLLDSAKRAELGTIGSSIAHELNNPLGGIITFAQIIKSETPKDKPYYSDIVALEQGALRCKDIVQNLLDFSRRPRSDEIKDIALPDVINQAIKILEVKTKPLGIAVNFEVPAKVSTVRADSNRLAQVFTHMLQQQVQNIIDTSRDQKGQISGQISWKLKEEKNQIVLEASDNSSAPLWDSNTNHFSFSLLDQVLRDFAASLEIPAPSSLDLKAKISFSRPVLDP
jgi:nitrogen-specific signal transduction histidine kinase